MNLREFLMVKARTRLARANLSRERVITQTADCGIESHRIVRNDKPRA
jgi:hypothetical protein